MTPTRLRPTWTDSELRAIYAAPHDHRIYGRGHHERVETMKDHAREVIKLDAPWVRRIADLSCGNGAVVRDAVTHASAQGELFSVVEYLGDIAPGWPYHGPIERTLEEIPGVDLFVNGETLEHLDDPAFVLKLIARKTKWLVLSTPTDNWDDTNAEHLWSWSEDDVVTMLTEAGFTTTRASVVDSREWGEPYRYGIWTACATCATAKE